MSAETEDRGKNEMMSTILMVSLHAHEQVSPQRQISSLQFRAH